MVKLSATDSLGGYDKEIGTMRLREISNYSLISLAIPQDKETLFIDVLISTSMVHLTVIRSIEV